MPDPAPRVEGRAHRGVQDRHPAPEGRAYGVAVLILAVALVVNTVLGPLVTGWIHYPIPLSLLHQLEGLELVTMALVVPLCVLSARLSWLGHAAAPLVGFGPSAYAAYMFAQYVVGPDYTTYSLAVLLHLAVFSLATGLALWSWAIATRTSWPPMQATARHRRAFLLLGLAAFVLLRYVPLLAGGLTQSVIPDEFAEAPAFYWSIVLLDLGLVVPFTCLAAVAVRRGSPVAVPALYAVVGWFALVPPSVAAMALVMVATGDPYASTPTLALLATAAIAFGALAIRLFVPLLRAPGDAAEAVGPAGSGRWPVGGERSQGRG